MYLYLSIYLYKFYTMFTINGQNYDKHKMTRTNIIQVSVRLYFTKNAMFSLFNALSAIRTPGHYNPFFYLFPITSLRHLFRLTLHKFPCLYLRIIFLTRYNPPAFHAKLSWQVSLPIELGYKKIRCTKGATGGGRDSG